jgi:uncharacterized protein (UPF0548 family)
VVLVKMMGFLQAPCRVVYVIDEPDIRGFAYGTPPGHPESGEERFAVAGFEHLRGVRGGDAFSRPGPAERPVGRSCQWPSTSRQALPARGVI